MGNNNGNLIFLCYLTACAQIIEVCFIFRSVQTCFLLIIYSINYLSPPSYFDWVYFRLMIEESISRYS